MFLEAMAVFGTPPFRRWHGFTQSCPQNQVLHLPSNQSGCHCFNRLPTSPSLRPSVRYTSFATNERGTASSLVVRTMVGSLCGHYSTKIPIFKAGMLIHVSSGTSSSVHASSSLQYHCCTSLRCDSKKNTRDHCADVRCAYPWTVRLQSLRWTGLNCTSVLRRSPIFLWNDCPWTQIVYLAGCIVASVKYPLWWRRGT